MTRALTLLLVAAAIAVTVIDGAPMTLPSIALSSTVLFHLERAAALLSAATLILLIVQRASRGELPIELSPQGIRYADRTDQALIGELGRLRERIDQLEQRSGNV